MRGSLCEGQTGCEQISSGNTEQSRYHTAPGLGTLGGDTLGWAGRPPPAEPGPVGRTLPAEPLERGDTGPLALVLL